MSVSTVVDMLPALLSMLPGEKKESPVLANSAPSVTLGLPALRVEAQAELVIEQIRDLVDVDIEGEGLPDGYVLRSRRDENAIAERAPCSGEQNDRE